MKNVKCVRLLIVCKIIDCYMELNGPDYDMWLMDTQQYGPTIIPDIEGIETTIFKRRYRLL